MFYAMASTIEVFTYFIGCHEILPKQKYIYYRNIYTIQTEKG